jgi:dienelactone hydrolase
MGTEPDEITTRDTIIWSEGLRLAATVVAPARRDGPLPAILLCHGWGGVREHLLNLYAGYFARYLEPARELALNWFNTYL